MTDKILQEQINELNQKLDRMLEFVEIQQRKREEWDDLVSDVSIVSKDLFQNSVKILDKAGVELDPCGIQCLLIKVLRNLETFGELLELMESAKDFMKDAAPIFRQIGLDAVNKLNEFEQKGTIEYITELARIIEKWTQLYPVEDLKNIRENLDPIAGILKNLSNPDLVASLYRITTALGEVKMDDQADNKSFWQLGKELRSPEVRKTISYTLRLLKEINKNQI